MCSSDLIESPTVHGKCRAIALQAGRLRQNCRSCQMGHYRTELSADRRWAGCAAGKSKAKEAFHLNLTSASTSSLSPINLIVITIKQEAKQNRPK